jgi:hypothetical protein
MQPLRNDPDFGKRGDFGGDAPRLVAGERLGATPALAKSEPPMAREGHGDSPTMAPGDRSTQT